MKENVQIAITTLVISIVLLIHNGREPLFLFAFASIPIILFIAWKKSSLWPVALYILIVGVLGRYTQYFRQGYMSDVLPAIQDYIGYFLSGKNVYKEIIMVQNGPAPFNYLPFALLWYLPARLVFLDLRFMEMIVASFVPLMYFLYGKLKGTWQHLPIVAVLALSPFILDLSSDGSNDNSAVFLLLTALVLFMYAQARNKKMSAILSALVLTAFTMFKHYSAFFLIFFLPYLTKVKQFPIRIRSYVLVYGVACLLLVIFGVGASPDGFWRSLVYIERTNFHPVYGWNIWVALKDGWGITASRDIMWMVRTVGTALTIGGLLMLRPWRSFQTVCLASAISMLTYLVLSEWTTTAYFSFLLPMFALSLFSDGRT
ncbi:hypothetical protein A2363_01400 [Candidatus Gottesmanbacteria bacterium RIFOXYB1_FULL_47_11]|uniref:Glycosyltransferase RgtA/B/C/D-like domain-containing protein n=1 Tax=Candidatus Gottesmanbacteria bacterium RIFOXYB1_FULL_47_11 TaxID=1798401 RepID=A0A1F6BDW6_9BACT|nr:MAG: hypothetical protein A2363_01400 [Candidatus Gottesmanbacteria bacterium RIFOXYB1_FULL_47_11]